MRYANNYRPLLVVILLFAAGVLCSVPSRQAAASPNTAGLTVTPATATLSLAKNEPEQHKTLTITNNYAVPVTLHFAFAPRQTATDNDKEAVSTITVATADATIGAGESLPQTITLAASDALAPGSAQVNLVISQAAITGTHVGILPELRLPIILVKQDGAVSSLSALSVGRPGVAFTTPKVLDITLKNTGNMIAIPRGFITLSAPGGRVVGKGTLNSGSIALSPGDHRVFSVAITPLHAATLPGQYSVLVRYGLGGDHLAKTAATTFVFVAWWHVALLIALLAAAYYLVRQHIPLQFRRSRRYSRAPPKRAASGHRRTA